MPNLSDLIARVEAASGPDRRLDAEIACAIMFTDLRPAEPDDHKEHQRGFPPSEGDIWCPTGFLMARSYTRSIDEALTLLPEGWWWSAGVCRRENHASVGSEIGTVEGELIFDAFGKTAPLALLAAILRARQAADTEGAKHLRFAPDFLAQKQVEAIGDVT